MAFKFITVLCATLAYANAGLIQSPIAAYSSAPAVSSVYSSIGSPSILAAKTVVAAAPSIRTISSIPAYQTIQTAPAIAKIAYSPAEAVSHVYSSIGAPSALSIAPAVHNIGVYSSPAIGSTQQNTIRSLGGTISHYSKAVDTPFSSVRKVDTRISNNGYAPALAYATPAIATSAIASPVISHVQFDGIGAHYGW